MDAAPGVKWACNSGGSQLLSGIVRHATGRFIDDYAREHLFAPLGITDFHWKKTPTGHPDTEGGLCLPAAGYQWWITSQNGVDVWAGRGFGGQLLLVIPARDTMAVADAWNVFGSPARNLAPPLIAALTAAP